MKHFYCLFTFLLFTCAAAAQGLPGYVITLSGDTLRGIVTERKHQRIELRSALNEVRAFRPATARGYGLEGSSAIRSRIVRLASGADSARFVMPTYTGPAGLYSYANESGFLLLPAATDTLYEVTAANWHVLFNRFLRACPAIDHTSRAMMEQRYDPMQLDRILMRYNKCVDSTWRKPQRAVRSVAWRRGVGVQAGFYKLHPPSGKDITSAHSQQLGIFWTAKRAHGFQVSAEGRLAYSRMETEPKKNRVGMEQQVIVQDWRVMAGLLAEQRVGRQNKLNAVGSIGFLISRQLQETVDLLERPAGSSSPYQRIDQSSGYNGAMLVHFIASAGALIPLGSSHEIKIAAQYQYTPPSIDLYTMYGLQVSYTLFHK